MSEVSFDSGGDEGKCVAALLTAGFDHRQHCLDKATAGSTLCPERRLPPNHRVTQRTLARIVRRLDAFAMQKRPQPLAMLGRQTLGGQELRAAKADSLCLTSMARMVKMASLKMPRVNSAQFHDGSAAMLPLAISAELKSKIPGVAVGWIAAAVHVTEHDSELWQEIEAAAARFRGMTMEQARKFPAIKGLRDAYKALGNDPTRYRGANEALVRRITQGKELYRVNVGSIAHLLKDQ